MRASTRNEGEWSSRKTHQPRRNTTITRHEPGARVTISDAINQNVLFLLSPRVKGMQGGVAAPGNKKVVRNQKERATMTSKDLNCLQASTLNAKHAQCFPEIEKVLRLPN